MPSEHMSNSLLNVYHITKILYSYKKSWSLNTMVTAIYRPEAELTLFLRVRTKGIANSLGKCMPIEELLAYYGKSRSPERMTGSDF